MPQPITAHQVIVGKRLVAHLFNRGQSIWLDWQDGYWGDPHRPVLGLMFEDEPGRRVSSTESVPSWFGHLLPEGVLRRRVTEENRLDTSGELPLLLRLGHDLPGAVQVAPAPADIDPTWQPDLAVIPSRPTRATRSGLRFSLAGVAMKFSMVLRDGRFVTPADDEDGDWIVKTPDAVHLGVPHNEFTIMSMARDVGIDVPEIMLVHRDLVDVTEDRAWPAAQEWAYAVRRFDRPVPGARLHMEDFAQVRGLPIGEAKYQGSYETVANIILKTVGIDAYLEFVRRVFFSYAVGNTDLHLKNVSLLYPDGRQPRLSPAYDMVATHGYGFTDLALKLDGSKRLERVTADSFTRLASRVGAPIDATHEAIRGIAARLSDVWEQHSDGLITLPAHREWLATRTTEVEKRFG